MLESVLGEVVKAIIKPIVQGVAEFAGYYTACILVPPASMGHMCVEPLGRKAPAGKMKYGCYRAGKGKIVVGHQLAIFLGVLFWMLMGLMGLVAYLLF